MAKSKNHTSHNQNAKAHRNGIKRPARFNFKCMRGRHQTFVQNCRNAVRNDPIQNKSLLAKILSQKLESDFAKLIVLKKKALIKLANDKSVSLAKSD